MPARPLHILHLDDDPLYLEQFAAMLAASSQDLGVVIRVTSVDDVDAYLEALAKPAPDSPDVAVLDVDIGGEVQGEEIARRTKATLPQCVVFMCSDLRGVGLVGACLGAGADDFIFKRSDDREVALRIYGTWKLRCPEPARESKGSGAVGRTMAGIATRVSRLVGSAVTALHVRGESGTGKELVSELLQAALPKGTPFVRVNCGAIAPTLLESELFGHVRGAFTGAQTDKIGLIEAADGGWIFFDEVATLSSAAQVALLRVLESRVVRRVGAAHERKVKVKVLSATNEPLEKLVTEGKFRADLWQRLCEATIELAPLRERMDEFPELARHFATQMDHGPYEIAESALGMMASYDWHEGNVRELRNCLRAMTELAVGQLLTPLSLPKWFWEKAEVLADSAQAASEPPREGDGSPGKDIRLRWATDGSASFERLVEELLLEIVKREGGVRGKVSIRHLARVTGIPKSTLATRLRELVDHGLIPAPELAKLVNVASE